MKFPEADHGLRHCHELAQANVDVHVLTAVGGAPVASPRITASYVMRDWSWRERPRLARFLKATAPDAVLLFCMGELYRNHPMITFASRLVKEVCPRATFVTQFSAAAANAGVGRGPETNMSQKPLFVGRRIPVAARAHP